MRGIGAPKGRGLDGFTLKCAMLVCMTLDHIRLFFQTAPLWFRWAGRMAMPVFVLLAVEGALYTKNRVRYALRLYAGFLFMGGFNLCLNRRLPLANGPALQNNIFETLLLLVLIIWMLEAFFSKEARRRQKALGGMCGLFVCAALPLLPLAPQFAWMTGAARLLLPHLLFCEGSVIVLAMGVLMYFTRASRAYFSLAFGLQSVLLLVLAAAAPVKDGVAASVFFVNFQWMQLLALPLLLCYNGRRGYGAKGLFYLYYPLHVYALYLAALLAPA